jgi:DUF438 domain-containing protein
MSTEEEKLGENALRERIRQRMQANRQAHPPQMTAEELQNLRTAASRLDQMLQASEEHNRQALQNATARLDQLLADIRTGKDFTPSLKRRRKQSKSGVDGG